MGFGKKSLVGTPLNFGVNFRAYHNFKRSPDTRNLFQLETPIILTPEASLTTEIISQVRIV